MKHAVSLAMVSLVLGFGSGCGPAESGDEDEEVTQQFLTSSKMVGDWSQLEGGHSCLAGMQYFYPAKFGVHLPLAGSSWEDACAPHAGCVRSGPLF